MASSPEERAAWALYRHRYTPEERERILKLLGTKPEKKTRVKREQLVLIPPDQTEGRRPKR